MDPNDLIDRYVHAVTHTLRSAERDDVARELRTLIEDMLAERADAAAPDEATVIEVLRHLGPPDEVAERYGQPRPYLVGPAYYPVFKLVTTIVLAVLGIVYLVGVVASLAFSGGGTATSLGGLLESAFDIGWTALANIGLMALIFAGIERMAPAQSLSEEGWDPRDLPSLNDPDRVSRRGQAIELGFDLAGLVVFNAIVRSGLPLLFVGGELVARFPIHFSDDFLAWVPWINLTFVLSIVLNLVLVVRNRWNAALRTAWIALNLFTLYVLLEVFGLPQIAAPAWMDTLCRIALAVVVIIVIIDTAQDVFRLFRRRGAPASAMARAA